jgi:hypothetical protein
VYKPFYLVNTSTGVVFDGPRYTNYEGIVTFQVKRQDLGTAQVGVMDENQFLNASFKRYQPISQKVALSHTIDIINAGQGVGD